MKRARLLVGCMVLLFGTPLFSQSDQAKPATTPPAEKVPVMDGGIGPCSVELTVTAGGKPVYGAIVRVHISYGFMGIKRMDLEAGTNSDGKVKFIGLPAKPKNPPLEFHATKDDLVGVANDNPQQECEAKHDLFLAKPKPQPPANQ